MCIIRKYDFVRADSVRNSPNTMFREMRLKSALSKHASRKTPNTGKYASSCSIDGLELGTESHTYARKETIVAAFKELSSRPAVVDSTKLEPWGNE